jgi:hypothetical protein
MAKSKVIKNETSDGTVNVKLHSNDISVLVDILRFAETASKFFATAEMEKGTTGGAFKMNQMARDAKTLHEILFRHLDIGEPDSTDIH